MTNDILWLFQVHELHSRNLELEKKSDKYEFEAKRAKEKQTSLEAENEVMFSERLLVPLIIYPHQFQIPYVLTWINITPVNNYWALLSLKLSCRLTG